MVDFSICRTEKVINMGYRFCVLFCQLLVCDTKDVIVDVFLKDNVPFVLYSTQIQHGVKKFIEVYTVFSDSSVVISECQRWLLRAVIKLTVSSIRFSRTR